MDLDNVVYDAAKKYDADIFKLSKPFKEFNNKVEVWKENQQFLDNAIDTRKEILDIGLDQSRSKRSIFYKLEKQYLNRKGVKTTKKQS